MKKEVLYNKKSRELLLKELEQEPFERITCSFYRYMSIENPESLRDELYRDWNDFQIFGRIYIAAEGINAQLSCPEHHWETFKKNMDSNTAFLKMPLKIALQPGESFYKLTIKVKNEIVAYGLEKNEYDMQHVGRHLNATQFNQAMEDRNTVVVDMRNYYESEVGRFTNAIIPDVDTSRELLPEVKQLLHGKEDSKVLLYCTGGIRCEKASAYLVYHGFQDVNQLGGGIIPVSYTHLTLPTILLV